MFSHFTAYSTNYVTFGYCKKAKHIKCTTKLCQQSEMKTCCSVQLELLRSFPRISEQRCMTSCNHISAVIELELMMEKDFPTAAGESSFIISALQSHDRCPLEILASPLCVNVTWLCTDKAGLQWPQCFLLVQTRSYKLPDKTIWFAAWTPDPPSWTHTGSYPGLWKEKPSPFASHDVGQSKPKQTRRDEITFPTSPLHLNSCC